MNTVTKLYHEHPKTILFAAAAALRLLLVVAFPALPDLLTLRAEISTPVNGFKRCMWKWEKDMKPRWRSKRMEAEIGLQCRRVSSSTSAVLIRTTAVFSTRLEQISHVDVLAIQTLIQCMLQGALILAAFLSSSVAREHFWPLDECHPIHLTGHPFGGLSLRDRNIWRRSPIQCIHLPAPWR